MDGFYKDSGIEVIAQIGDSEYVPKNIDYVDFLSPAEAESTIRDADMVIAHAGMGSILTALSYQTPILVIPRKASLGEHRNEHQLATCEWVQDLDGVFVARDEHEAQVSLKKLRQNKTGVEISQFAQPELINYLKSVISE